MPTVETPTNRPDAPTAGGGDDLDALFDYDVEMDDVFRDLSPPRAAQNSEASAKKGTGTGLGIDEEVEVARKPRAPRVKLDEDR